MTTLLVLIKGLPLAFVIKAEPLFDAFDTVEACLELAAVAVNGMSFRVEKIESQLDLGFLDATTVMEFLIGRGVPRRTASGDRQAGGRGCRSTRSQEAG